MDYPHMYKIRQTIETPELIDIETVIEDELTALNLAARIQPGDRIAITAGSRGINNIVRILKQVVRILKDYKAEPFIVPAMGSHGNGTAEGQANILNSLNINEETMGIPIVSSMEVVKIAVSSCGFPVFVDKIAAGADGIVVVNRVKPHTEFEGPVESGLMKMMAIGLGKHKGCEQVHKQTIDYGYSRIIPEIGSIILNHTPVLFGLGIVENLYDETACIKACLPVQFEDTEKKLLVKAKTYLARLPFKDIDILIVDEIGKNISGTGMDTNVIGRIMFIGEPEPEYPKIKRIIVLGLTSESHGNGVGLGLADLTVQRVIDKIDTQAMATNALAAMTPEKARLPIALETDKKAVNAALNIIGTRKPEQSRIIHIKNTLEMGTLHISEAFKDEMAGRNDLELIEDLGPISFDSQGNINSNI